MNIARRVNKMGVLESQLSAKFLPISQLSAELLSEQLALIMKSLLTFFFHEFDILAIFVIFFLILKLTHELVPRSEAFAAK